MVQYQDNNGADNNNNSVAKVKSIDELLAAKRANNKLGSDKASEATQRASEAIRQNSGKAKRSQLRNNLMKQASLAEAEGEEQGIKEFLNQDILAAIAAINSKLQTKYLDGISADETKLLEGEVIDVDWSDYTNEYDTSFDTNNWGWDALEGSETLSLPSNKDKDEVVVVEDNRFTMADFPE